MKILMIHSNFNQRNILKQPWRVTYELSRQITKLGHKVVIFTDVNDAMELKVDSVEVKSVKYEQLRFKIKQIKSLLEDFDILVYFGNSLSGIYLDKLRGDRPLLLYISSVHYSFSELSNLSLRELKSHWVHLLFSLYPFSFIVRLLNSESISAVIVPNVVIKKRLVEYGVDEGKIHVLPVGFDMKEFESGLGDDPNRVRDRLELSTEDFIITYFGSPLTIRGTDTLIRSMYILKKKLKKFRCVILSRTDSFLEKKENEYLLSLINRFGLSDVIHLIPGVQSREHVKRQILASDVIALPFKIVQSEPPLSILESMALGKPVITTLTCGLSELVTPDRGLLVKPNDAKSLASAIYELAKNPERKAEMGQNAKEFVSKLPGWDFVAKLYERFFENLLNRYSEVKYFE